MEQSYYNRLTTSGVVKASAGWLKQILVNASSSGTLTLRNDPATAAGDTITNAFPLTAGQVINIPNMEFSKGLYATLGGTADVTFIYG